LFQLKKEQHRFARLKRTRSNSPAFDFTVEKHERKFHLIDIMTSIDEGKLVSEQKEKYILARIGIIVEEIIWSIEEDDWKEWETDVHGRGTCWILNQWME
jgi:ribosome-associated translation inhibitor RaiA